MLHLRISLWISTSCILVITPSVRESKVFYLLFLILFLRTLFLLEGAPRILGLNICIGILIMQEQNEFILIHLKCSLQIILGFLLTNRARLTKACKTNMRRLWFLGQKSQLKNLRWVFSFAFLIENSTNEINQDRLQQYSIKKGFFQLVFAHVTWVQCSHFSQHVKLQSSNGIWRQGLYFQAYWKLIFQKILTFEQGTQKCWYCHNPTLLSWNGW